MKNNAKRVVILDKFVSPYISQVIVVLNNYNPTLETKVIQEAERVVTNYFNSNYPPKNKKRSYKSSIITMCIIVLCLGIIAYCMTQLF